MDLLGRKVVAQNGRPFALLMAEIEKTIATANQFPELRAYALELNDAQAKLKEVTHHLIGVYMNQGAEFFLADATLYLEFFGIVAVSWQWLLQGIAIRKVLQNTANRPDIAFYQGKFVALRFFFSYELPKTLGMAKRLLNSDGLTVNMTADLFAD
jgi:butyryl-CoA dehydrogenase